MTLSVSLMAADSYTAPADVLILALHVSLLKELDKFTIDTVV